MKKTERLAVLAKTDGHCAYCGTPLAGKFHVDHVEPVKREHTWKDGQFKPTGKLERPELDHIDNMLPACPSCNIAKSAMPLEHFRDLVADKLNQLELHANYRIAKRYGLLKETPPEKVVFYFEKIKKDHPDSRV